METIIWRKTEMEEDWKPVLVKIGLVIMEAINIKVLKLCKPVGKTMDNKCSR